jgi:hypothetical protein
VHVDGARITIADGIEGALTAPATWSAGFTFHQTATVETREDGAIVTMPTGARLQIALHLANAGKVALERVDVSPGFGKLAKAPRLVASGEIVSAGAVLTTIFDII